MKLTLYGDPRTKKNSARILQGSGGRRFVAPSAAFEEYQTGCLWQIRSPPEPISARVNVRCVYYMATRRKVDLANLIEATSGKGRYAGRRQQPHRCRPRWKPGGLRQEKPKS